MPLNVMPEFRADAVHLLGLDEPPYCRTMAEVKACQVPIILTNYERVRDGDIDPHYFTAVSLDEAATLRSFGSKTYQEFMQKFKGVRYKLTNTATPSPNRYKELIHYAGFFGSDGHRAGVDAVFQARFDQGQQPDPCTQAGSGSSGSGVLVGGCFCKSHPTLAFRMRATACRLWIFATTS